MSLTLCVQTKKNCTSFRKKNDIFLHVDYMIDLMYAYRWSTDLQNI